MKTACPFFVTAIGLSAVALSSAAATLHVATNGNDALSGNSWAFAKRTVTSALSAATAGDAIWIAAGRHAERITLKPDVALYGGFAGNETTLSQRNWQTNLSILDGTNGGAVVNITNAGPATRIDGMVITGGLGIHGGGIAMVASAPVIANNLITANITDGAGAGVSIWGFRILSSTEIYLPLLSNNIIFANQSINDEGDGGGVAVVSSSPVIVQNVIARNTATRNGGGIACWRHSLPLIANNFLEANSASYDEGTASTGGGGVFASATDLDGRPIAGAISAPFLVNNVIAANGARSGGGVALIDSLLGAGTLQNNTIAGNSGAGVFWGNTSPTNENNLVAFNTWGFERSAAFTNEATLRHNNVFGNSVLGANGDYRFTPPLSGTAGNISVDPRFANHRIGDFHLQPDSPCVNAGSTSPRPAGQPDIDGEARVFGAAVDIGADESDGTRWNVPTPIRYVSTNGNDGDGRSWATAKRSIRAGVNAVATLTGGGELWVAEGTYPEQIEVPAYVSLYGGFAGRESSRDERSAADHPTIIDGGGAPTLAYVRNAGFRLSTLDGFVLQNGGNFTRGNPLFAELAFRTNHVLGGAIYCRVSSPVIANNLIRTNSIGSPYTAAQAQGAGLYGYLSHALITGNTFLENENLNTFDGKGGGVYSLESMMDIDGNVFRANRARVGSAFYATRSTVRFAGNIVESNSMYNSYPLSAYLGSQEGAIALTAVPNFLVDANQIRGNVAQTGAGLSIQSCEAGRVANNLVVNNRAAFATPGGSGMGGGIYCLVNLNTTNLVLANNAFVGNTAPALFGGELGGAIAMTLVRSNLTVANNVIVSNSSGIWRPPGSTLWPALRFNCVNNSNSANYLNLAPGWGDFTADPRLTDRAGGDFRLQLGSPCIDAAHALDAPAFDFDGVGRPLDGDTNGVPRPDIGPFEFAHEAADTDGDAMRDAAEVIAGTNPADSGSVLRLSVRLDSLRPGVALTWPSVPGRIYQVESKPGFDPVRMDLAGSWEMASGLLPGTGKNLETFAATDTSTNRFYRVGVKREGGVDPDFARPPGKRGQTQ